MLGRIPDLHLLGSTSVVVRRPAKGDPDPFGRPTETWEEEPVSGALASPGSTSDLDADRPDGARVDMTFHFPRGYGRPLKGCRVRYGGREYRVIGDPQPSMETMTPGPWSLSAETERVDG